MPWGDKPTTMTHSTDSSRRAFEKYKTDVGRKADRSHGAPDGRTPVPVRSLRQLFFEFWRLVGRERGPVVLALAALTLATVLGLIPPAATKFIVDYVLGEQPIPERWQSYLQLPEDPFRLLILTIVAVTLVAGLRIAVHTWSDWQATRSAKRLHLSVRLKVFAHAVRLPLHRVDELKSGGAASILRQDAGSVGDLIHGMESSPFLVETLHGSRWVMQPSSSISSTSSPQFSALAGGLRGALEDDGSRSPSSGAVRCR